MFGSIKLNTFNGNDTNTASKFARCLRNHKFFYYMFKTDEKVYIFHDGDGGVEIPFMDIGNLDWDTITMTKTSSRISSNIHETKEKVDKSELVVTHEIISRTDAPEVEEERMWNEARILAGNPNPQNIVEADVAIKEVYDKYVDVVIANGYHVTLSLFSKRWVNSRTNVAWEPVNSIKVPLKSRRKQYCGAEIC